MSTLDSTSTRPEVQAAYDNNASYEEDNSPAKCRAFITACRFLVRLTAQFVSASGSEQVGMDVKLIEGQLRDAKKWLTVNDTSRPAATQMSLENYRS